MNSGRYASCAAGRVHETPLVRQADPVHPKGQPMGKRRAQRPAGCRVRSFLMGIPAFVLILVAFTICVQKCDIQRKLGVSYECR